MSSDAIRARMGEVRTALAAVRSARGRLHGPMQDADRLIRGAGESSVLTSRLLGGAASGADLRISGRLRSTAEAGKTFKRRLEDAYAQLSSRADEFAAEYEGLKRELEEELRREAAARAANRR